MSVYQWSTTAADNANSDPNINWSEGQNANTVNNSARAMMAALAAFLKQVNGSGTSGGAANAYTFTSPSGHAFTAYAAGMIVCFLANHTNTNAATINVDGLGAKSLRKFGATNVAAGDIETGQLVLAIYDGTNFQVLSVVANNIIQAFSGLSPVADRMAYFDGASSMALATLTAFGRSIAAVADAAALRSLGGLVIGTDVQAFDSDLAAIAALSTTSFGRTFLTLANAAAARSHAGIPENTRNITFGTGAPGALGTGEIYLRHD